MKYLFIICTFFCTNISSQTNLIKNGTFCDTSSWDLAFYNNSSGRGCVNGGKYQITLTNPGTERWAVQFKQNEINLDSGSVYRFSFEVSSSKVRSIEASISRNGGDYFPYSGRDTFEVSTTKKKFERTFFMHSYSDKSARVEFNCGKYDGILNFSNVELVRIPGPVITLKSPQPGNIFYEGSPFKVSWFSTGVDSVKLDLSIDNGLSWIIIVNALPDAGSYTWIPGTTYSPWSKLRITSTSNENIKCISETFEIAPRIELLKNGTFSDSAAGWNLGVYGGKASGIVNSRGIYKISIDSSGSEKWHVQFTQTGIPLQAGVTYTLQFTAYAEKNSTIGVDLTRHLNAYKSMLDSSQTILSLTTQPRLFSIEFTANGTNEPDSRLEFNCGTSAATVYIDDVSLTKKFMNSGIRSTHKPEQFQTTSTVTVISHFIQLRGASANKIHMRYNGPVDLLGRSFMGKDAVKQHCTANAATGVYISKHNK